MQRRQWSREAEANVPVGGLLTAVAGAWPMMHPRKLTRIMLPPGKLVNTPNSIGIARRFDAKGGARESPDPPCLRRRRRSHPLGAATPGLHC